MRQGSKPGALVERDTLLGIWNRNAGAGTALVVTSLAGPPKTWKVDFLAAPSRKLPGALAATGTEHVRAASRMRRRGPGRFLLRNPRRLLAPPELSVAGPASFSSGGLLVVSEPPPVPPSLSSAPRLGRPFPETAVMSARLPAPCPPRWWLLLSLLLLGAAPGPRRGAAFYLPGLAPVNFCEDEKKSDECKVGAARRTTPASPCPGGSRGPRGRGRSRRGPGVAVGVPRSAVRGRGSEAGPEGPR